MVVISDLTFVPTKDEICNSCCCRVAEKQQPVCLRCGRLECDGVVDSVRAAGGCTSTYSRGDLAHVRCYVCGKKGHLCCAQPPATTYRYVLALIIALDWAVTAFITAQFLWHGTSIYSNAP